MKKIFGFTLAEVFHPAGKSRRIAFTLAEVLITLGIIGVVAALTMPVLISKHQERSYIVALKKNYSILSQAYQFVVNDYGNPTEWNLEKYTTTTDDSGTTYTSGSADRVANYFAKYLKTVKFCPASDKDCMTLPPQKYLNGNSDMNFRNGLFSSMVLNDGSILHLYISSNNCENVLNSDEDLRSCGNFYVDVNGFKKPNRRGVDFFEFYLTNKGILPVGIPGKSSGSDVSETGYSDFGGTCADVKTMRGYGCGAWVLTYDNMDYLHCDDLSWNGKTKCN